MPSGRTLLLTGRHVLVVDDHEETRKFLRQALEFEGATVADAVTADEALGILNGTKVDAVLTDVGPGGREPDGPWLVRQMLASPRLCQMCVIALTRRKELERELLKLGFWAVLIKPVEAMDVAAFVLGCLERRR